MIRPLVIAHRGASRQWPEHSRPAFVQALLDGADGLEHPTTYGWAAEDAVLEVLQESGWRPGVGGEGLPGISLMSWHPGSLVHLHRSVPAENLMPLVDSRSPEALAQEVVGGSVERVGALVAQSAALADAAAVGGAGPSLAFLRENPARVAAWRGQGVTVRVWTVDDPEDLTLCLRADVDEVMTNRPAEVLSALAALAALPGATTAS